MPAPIKLSYKSAPLSVRLLLHCSCRGAVRAFKNELSASPIVNVFPLFSEWICVVRVYNCSCYISRSTILHALRARTTRPLPLRDLPVPLADAARVVR